MTPLERLIRTHVEHATVTTISNATERIAEELAQEILKDPKFRAEMRTKIQRYFGATLDALTAETNGRRPRKGR